MIILDSAFAPQWSMLHSFAKNPELCSPLCCVYIWILLQSCNSASTKSLPMGEMSQHFTWEPGGVARAIFLYTLKLSFMLVFCCVMANVDQNKDKKKKTVRKKPARWSGWRTAKEEIHHPTLIISLHEMLNANILHHLLTSTLIVDYIK